MTIYEPLVADGYEWINCCNDEDYEVFLDFNGSRRAEQWRAVDVRRVRADSAQEFRPSDFPWLGAHALVMRARAVEVLHDMLNAYGEILPLCTGDGVELWVFNASVVCALDESRSEIVRFPDGSRIMRIRKVSFVESAVRDVDIFRLPHRASSTYVSQGFVDRCLASGLVGLEFKKVWNST